MRLIKWVVPAIALVLFAAACSPPPPPPPPPVVWSPVPYGMIKTEGVVIEAERGDFVLRSGERFATPFDASFALGSWSATGLPDAGSYRACRGGCRKVRVTVPGQSERLYGILHFAQMHPSATGPGTRSYLIQIPRNYVDEASDGRVSVIYETVSFDSSRFSEHAALLAAMTDEIQNGSAQNVPGASQTGWTLWLSDMPFPDCDDPC